MKNKRIFKTFSALCAALVLMMGLSVTAFAQGTEELPAEDATNDSNVVVEETEDSPALTPDGNAALVDDFGGNKQLITVTTKAGNYFYILIDRANEDKETAVHYYYCPTGKKHGCTNPVMLKESDLVECVKDSLKGYIDNVSCLQAILDGIDQGSINQALANEYASHIAANEQQVEQALEFKARLYENLITGTISKEEYTDYKARYTRIAENAKESIRVLKEKLADVLENRSERNRWISHFTQFSTMETLDRKAVVHMIQSIKVIGKKELEITFTYQDEYQKAIQLIQLAEQTSQRKVG